MKTVHTNAIITPPSRQRREFPLEKLNELGESIARNGLFHAIVVREENGSKFLVSGERRLRAIKDLNELGTSYYYDRQLVPAGHIPYTDIGELDGLARKEAEFEENFRRENLSWQEEADAVKQLAALRGEQAAAAGGPAPTVAAIAEEWRGSSVGIHQENTRRQLIVANHLDDPEIKGAKNVDEAFKILRRKEDVARRVQLAAEVGRTYSAETAHHLLNEDSLLWMVNAAGDQFDVICTDPPYGIGADEFGDSGGHTAGAHQYEDSYEYWQTAIKTLAQQGYRITKPQAHLYCFCDITRFEEFKQILAAAGWKPFRTPIIWHKPNGNRLPWVNQGPQRKFEIILYANKGSKLVTRIYPDLVTYPADENLGHNAQKPVALYTDLLRRSVGPGDRVVDPFAGSGPILPAANELKCKATAVEVDPAAYALCVKRLDALKNEPELEGLV